MQPEIFKLVSSHHIFFMKSQQNIFKFSDLLNSYFQRPIFINFNVMSVFQSDKFAFQSPL